MPAAAAASVAAPGRSSSGGGRSMSRLPPLLADVTRCGQWRTPYLATRNELRPFPGPDSYALLLYLLCSAEWAKNWTIFDS